MKKNNPKGLLPVFITLIVLACNNYSANNQTIDTEEKAKSENLMYDLSQPSKKIELPLELREISGLSYYINNELICMHDEKADIYLVDYKTENVTNKSESDILGDYEGVEYVNGNIWLVRNDGVLMEIVSPYTQSESKNTYELDKVSPKNDIEGLGYDPKTNSLLIAFKEKAHLKKEEKLEDTRAIYLFNLKSKKLETKPFLLIDLKEINNKYDFKNFMPSGIAHHPVEDKFYIISASNNGLLVLSRESEILYAEKLSKSDFEQPEGICFSPDGELLFISNEGKNKKGNILVFDKIKSNKK